MDNLQLRNFFWGEKEQLKIKTPAGAGAKIQIEDFPRQQENPPKLSILNYPLPINYYNFITVLFANEVIPSGVCVDI